MSKNKPGKPLTKIFMEKFRLACVLQQQHRLTEAASIYEELLQINPNIAEIHNNLGLIQAANNLPSKAVLFFQKAISLKSNYIMAYYNLGQTYQSLGLPEKALECYDTCIKLDPENIGAHCGKGDISLASGKFAAAGQSYEAALLLCPDSAPLHNNFANALMKQGFLTKAESHYRKALQPSPVFPEICNNLGNCLKMQGRIEESIYYYRQALHNRPDFWQAHSNLLLAMHYRPFSASVLYEEHQRFNRQHAEHLASHRTYPHAFTSHRIRIGYVSPDFRRHSVSFFIEPVLANHNQSAFQIFCYSSVSKPDSTTFRLSQYENEWRDISALDDETVAELIRNDKIDILVDLSGHTAANRLMVFARRPAPVQVTWLGYPDTTGMTAIDYRLVDGVTDSVGYADLYASECLYRLPHPFLCYRPDPEMPAQILQKPYINPNSIVFASFNNFAKISTACIQAWSKILEQVPNSCILIKSQGLDDPEVQGKLLNDFAKCSISSDRVTVLSSNIPFVDHIKKYELVDIALDTYPYNGTTTTCEALWMGVPVITLVGQHHVSRVGLSILTSVGLQEYAVSDWEKYIESAVSLANNTEKLTQVKTALRNTMASSVLCDEAHFTRKLEAAYLHMREKWLLHEIDVEYASILQTTLVVINMLRNQESRNALPQFIKMLEHIKKLEQYYVVSGTSLPVLITENLEKIASAFEQNNLDNAQSSLAELKRYLQKFHCQRQTEAGE